MPVRIADNQYRTMLAAERSHVDTRSVRIVSRILVFFLARKKVMVLVHCSNSSTLEAYRLIGDIWHGYMLHVAVLNGAVALLVISDDKPLVGHYSAYRCRLTNLVRAVIKRCSALAVGRDNDIVVIQHSLPYIFRHAGIVPLHAAGIRHRLVSLIARPVLIVEGTCSVLGGIDIEIVFRATDIVTDINGKRISCRCIARRGIWQIAHRYDPGCSVIGGTRLIVILPGTEVSHCELYLLRSIDTRLLAAPQKDVMTIVLAHEVDDIPRGLGSIELNADLLRVSGSPVVAILEISVWRRCEVGKVLAEFEAAALAVRACEVDGCCGIVRCHVSIRAVDDSTRYLVCRPVLMISIGLRHRLKHHLGIVHERILVLGNVHHICRLGSIDTGNLRALESLFIFEVRLPVRPIAVGIAHAVLHDCRLGIPGIDDAHVLGVLSHRPVPIAIVLDAIGEVRRVVVDGEPRVGVVAHQFALAVWVEVQVGIGEHRDIPLRSPVVQIIHRLRNLRPEIGAL